MTGSTIPTAGRHRRLAGVLTLLILAAVYLLGFRLRPARVSSSATQVPLLKPSALTVSPGIHLLGGLAPAAAYVVETSEGLVLVDSGVEADATPLKWELARLGLDWRRLRAILLTHAHADHSLGAQQLRAAAGAKVYAGREDSAVLRAGQPREAFFSTFAFPPGTTLHPTTVDFELSGDETIEVGGVRFKALATPGHTPGSTCYLMERENLHVLFSGDVIMSLAGSQGWQPLGTYAAYQAPRYRGDARAFLSSLLKLRALPVPDLVLPGHPRQDAEPQRPALSQQRWQTLLDDGIRELEELVARYERDGASFLDGIPKKLLPGVYYLGDRAGRAVYGLFASSKFLLVDAPGGPGLIDFLNAQLPKLGVQPAAPAAVLLTACGPEETAGLKELVTKSHAQVVAARAGLPRLKEVCPAGTLFLAGEDLPEKGWFGVKAIPLRGRGLAPMAYQVSCSRKTILFSGRMPIKLHQEELQELLRDFAAGRGNSSDYYDSLNQLGALKPDLWLPALPLNGQNANLYGREWAEIIAGNRKLLP